MAQTKKKTVKKTIKTSLKSEPDKMIGKKVDSFQLESTEGTVTEKSLKNSVIYFYPKDNTSGCTQEGLDFKDNFLKFKKAGYKIYGVSRDSLKSHEGFRLKQQFPFHLISDPDEVLCKIFDVMKMKSLYGRKYLGVDRSTFVVDSSGKIKSVWRGVKVPGHVEAVFNSL